MWTNRSLLACLENSVQQERLLSSASSVEKTAQSSGARRWCREFRPQCPKHQPKPMNVAVDISATSRNNIQEFSFWQEKNDEEVKELNVTRSF
jgi:hypothetical protein